MPTNEDDLCGDKWHLMIKYCVSPPPQFSSPGTSIANIGVARIFDWGCPVLSTVKSEVELFILSQYHKQAMLVLHCFCALV